MPQNTTSSKRPMESRCCLHIGLPKTATKTLQWHLFARHSQIEYLGRFDGKPSKPYKKFENCRNSAVQAIMRELVRGEGILNPDFDLCHRLFAESIVPAIEEGRTPVWSLENLALDVLDKRRARANNLRTVFGKSKVIITIRHPQNLLESTYCQILKRENLDRQMRMNLFGKYSCYFTIEQWLEKCFDGEIMPHLEYAETIEMYSNIFGKDAVAVYLYEDIRRDLSGFIEGLCRFIGIDHAEGIRLTQGKRENTRWTQGQIRMLKLIDRSPMKFIFFRFPTSRIRRHILQYILGDPRQDNPPAQAVIPPQWCERIAEVTRDGNRWLTEHWDLELERYGYPL